MKQHKIEVVIVEPHRVPHRLTIDNTTEAMEVIVGGLYQVFPSDDGLRIIRRANRLRCTEHGTLKMLPLNRAWIYNGKIIDIIAGTFIVCGAENGDFASLTNDQIESTIKRYYFGEDFVFGGHDRILTAPTPRFDNMTVAELIQKANSLPKDVAAMLLLQDVWSNEACYGYVIAATEALGYTAEQTEQVVTALKEQFDRMAVGNAALHYRNSKY